MTRWVEKKIGELSGFELTESSPHSLKNLIKLAMYKYHIEENEISRVRCKARPYEDVWDILIYEEAPENV